MTVNTKKADRRDISFATLDDILADIDAIERAHDAGTLTHTGNWNAGENFQHCARVFEAALDGFPPGGPPALLRIAAKLLFKKRALAGEPPPPGIKIPKAVSVFNPDEGVTFERGAADLRAVIERIKSGETMTHPSPLLGDLTHEEWLTIQISHCQMHFSFLHP